MAPERSSQEALAIELPFGITGGPRPRSLAWFSPAELKWSKAFRRIQSLIRADLSQVDMMYDTLFKPTVANNRLAAIAQQAFRTIKQRPGQLEIDGNLSVLVLVVHEAAVRATDDPTLLFTLYEQAVEIASDSTPFPPISAQIAREVFLEQFGGLRTSVQRQFPLKTDLAWFDWFRLLFGSLTLDQLESEAGLLFRNDVIQNLSALGSATALATLTTLVLLPEDPVVRSAIEHLFAPVKACLRADGGHTVYSTLLSLLGKIGNDAAIGESVLFKLIVARLFFLALRERRLARLIPAFVPFRSTDTCSQQFVRISQAMTNPSFLDGFRAAASALIDQIDRCTSEASLAVPSDLPLDYELSADAFLLPGPLPLVVYPEWHGFAEIWNAYAHVVPEILELRARLEVLRGRLLSFADTLIDDLQTRASRAIKTEGEVWPLPANLLGGLATVFPQVRFQYRTAGSASIARLGFIQRSGGMVIVEPAIDATIWIGTTDLLEVVTILYALAVLHDLLVPVRQIVSSAELTERYARRGEVRPADRTRTYPEGSTIVRVRRRVVRDEPLGATNDQPVVSRTRIVMELEGDDPRPCVANRAFWRRVHRAGEPLAMTRRQFERWKAFHAATGFCSLPEGVVDWTLDHRPVGYTWHPQSRAYAHGVLPGTVSTATRQLVLEGDTAVAQLTQLLLAD